MADPFAQLRPWSRHDAIDRDARFPLQAMDGVRLNDETKQRASASFVVSWQKVTEGAAANWSFCKITTGRCLRAYPSPPTTVQSSPRCKHYSQASFHSDGS
jgi:hypothetical protein